VASMVKTRTVVQTRTHAQKYFQKVSKSGGGEDSENENDATEESAVKVVPFSSERSSATVSSKSSSPSKVSSGSPPTTSSKNKGSSGMEGMCDGYVVKSPAREEVTASQAKQHPYGYHAYTVPSSTFPTIGPDSHESDPYWTGKRKHFELTSAEVLAGQPYPSKTSDGSNSWNWGPTTRPYPGREPVRIGRNVNQDTNEAFPSSLSSEFLMDMEGEGAQVLSMMKEMNETNLSMPNEQSTHHTNTVQKVNTAQAGRGRGSNSLPSGLTIFNPESINHYTGTSSDNQDAPDTPWESEVRALEARIAFLPRDTSVGGSENSDGSHLQKLSTPSEQRDFMKRVTTLLDRGFRGVSALEALLSAAATNVQEDSDGENPNTKEGSGSGKKPLYGFK
jgi:hypothetical protein